MEDRRFGNTASEAEARRRPGQLLADATSGRTDESITADEASVHTDLDTHSARMRGAAGDHLEIDGIELQDLQAVVESVPGGAGNLQDAYPLSPLQEGLLFQRALSEKDDTYVLSLLFELSDQEKVGVLVDALQRSMNRHDALRTAILWKGVSRPLQIVCRRTSLNIEHVVLNDKQSIREQINPWMRPGALKFDLTRPPLGKLVVFSTPANDQVYALLQLHHLISDHQSMQMIAAEVLRHARGVVDGGAAEIPYRSYVEHVLADPRAGEATRFFRERLADIDEPTAPFGILVPEERSPLRREASERLNHSLLSKVRFQVRQSGTTVARLFHSAWALVLAYTTGRADVVFGTVILAGQQRRERRTVGLLVNTLPLRLSLGSASVSQLLEQTHREIQGLVEHESVPLTLALGCSGMGKSAPLFSTIFNYRRPAIDRIDDSFDDSSIRVVARGEAWTNYPITVLVDDEPDGITITTQTDERINAGRMLEYLKMALGALIDALANTPDSAALSLAVMPPEELNKVVRTFNFSATDYRTGALIHEIFEQQVGRTPHEVAIVCGEQHVTYLQLNHRANQLARWLIKSGVARESFVGLYVERGIPMIVGMLGILKAGGAYVPLDPDYPEARLMYIVNDTKLRLVVTSEILRGRLSKDLVSISIDTDRQLKDEPTVNIARTSVGIDELNLAYVIYTSGSTGQPKGVAIEHRNAVNLIRWAQSSLPESTFEETLQSTSINFDLSVYECFVPLSVGGKLRIVKNAVALLHERPQVTLINTVPSAMKAILEAGAIPRVTKVINLAGEPLKREVVEGIFSESRVSRVCNLYGPSETTTYSTWVSMSAEDGFNPTIGRPVANTQIYVLSSHQRPLPIGVVGEIYIGGAGVARGYLNRPELTAARFLADPFRPDMHTRMYRTGDLGRWREDGTIEYLGRNDHQIKVRGFRIELGEIESNLVRSGKVSEAVVVVREDAPGDRRLVAYVAPNRSGGEDALDVRALRNELQASLPDYMLPNAFVVLEKLPLSPNGKIDRRALPEPALDAYASAAYEAPLGEVEEMLAGIWQNLLGLERVGRHDSFFQLGGHSLLILQMLERLDSLGMSVDLRSIYQSGTLADLASAVVKQTAGVFEVPQNRIPHAAEVITPEMLPLVHLSQQHIDRIVQLVPGGAANIKDIYPLAPLQEGILFHHLRNEGGGDTYVLPVVLTVRSPDRLNDFVAAVQSVIDRHDVLRTAILWEHLPKPVQVVYRHAAIPVTRLVLEDDVRPEDQVEEWIHPKRQRINLRQAPPMKLHCATRSDGRSDVLLQIHHMQIDHMTLEIVVSEIVACLGGRTQNLPESVPYRDHVAQLLARAATDDSETFFRAKLNDVSEPSAPFGIMDVHGDGSQVIEATEKLSTELVQQVRAVARRLGVTTATMIHAAFGLLVARTAGQDDIVFGSVLLGRLQANARTQRSLGMFINTLPVRLKLGSATVRSLIQQTHRELIELISHEQASLSAAQRCSGITSPAPLFTALLNYRHSISNVYDQWNAAEGIELIKLQERTNYPVTMAVDDYGDGLSLTTQTDCRIDASRVNGYMRAAIQSIIDLVEVRPEISANKLSILPLNEQRLLIQGFNEAADVRPSPVLIHEQFEAQAARTPRSIALVFDDSTITYASLNRSANKLGCKLLQAGVVPGDRVGLYLERSIEMVVGILAVLKVGGAYVPLDPSYPTERLQYMVEDSSPSVILTQEQLVESVPRGKATILIVADVDPKSSGGEQRDIDLPSIGIHPKSPAYVIYTSGSTGKPKGVMISHQNVTRLFAATQRWFDFSASDVWTLFHSFAFDFSVWELWGGLFYGGRVILIPKRLARSPEDFYKLICRQGVTVLNQTPSAFTQLIDAQSRSAFQHSLRLVIFGGEALDMSALRPWLQRNGMGSTLLVNMYGITETTVHVTYYEVTRDDIEGSSASRIGRPIPDLCVYILDPHLQPVPIGVVGELYVGGAGVALGYMNRPELTASRFLPDPFNTTRCTRLYRTGDLGRWRSDGNLEYLGRNDEQVKIRGFRIELGEIKAQLLRHASVKDAAVIVRQDESGEKWLTAYVVPRDGADGTDCTTAEVLRSHLKEVLPEHMVPGAFVVLKSMPLTANGKLDRKRLPAAGSEAYGRRAYQPPRGHNEQTIVDIWKSLLTRQRIGRQDNFFELGGHSLLALRAANAISAQLGSVVSVNDIYGAPTPVELAEQIARGKVTPEFVDLQQEAILSEDIVAKPGILRSHPRAILLTGATGFVGRFLLVDLLKETEAHIYCLVRAGDEQQGLLRIRSSLDKWNLWNDQYRSRIVAIPGDLALPRLGLDEQLFEHLSSTIDCVYHCGTSMNHLETYSSAKPANVGSAREILKLATRSKPKIVNYISTLSVFSPMTERRDGWIDEEHPIGSERHLVANGYAASKWVAEKIFMAAGERGVRCNIFRLGLIWADTQRGRYDEAQHFYRLFKSCLLSGLGVRDFSFGMPLTPVDLAARAIVRLGSSDGFGTRVFHISSSVPAPVKIFERLQEIGGRRFMLLPEHEWMRTMVRLDPEGRRLSIVPLIQSVATMKEEFLKADKRRRERLNSKFLCDQTNRELKAAGITWPQISDEMIEAFIADLVSRESESSEVVAEVRYASFATDDS